MDKGYITFAGDKDSLVEPVSDRFWKIMVVDDEQSIHDITGICLNNFTFEGHGIRILNAFSGKEARSLFKIHPDTALMLVDVVMEAEDSGLQFVRHVREKTGNTLVQIAIRTGQPGFAPENKVICKYMINSYYSKTEVTAQKLVSLVTTSLRTYHLSKQLAQELERRKHAERQLLELNKNLEKKIKERTRQLSRADQMKTQFLANMSHEIRTPMNGIISMSTMLVDEPLTALQKEYASIIHSSANILLTIINDILDLSKIEEGQLDFEIRRFCVKKLLNEVFSIFKLKAAEKQLELIIQTDKGVPRFLEGDETRIKQILINLVSNAVKFTSRGFVRVMAYVEKNMDSFVHLAFEVEDTGPGIRESFKKKLFEKFSQEDASITRKYGGTGLGLAISKQLALMMGGNIHVWNKKQGGAVFKVVLKIKKQTALTFESKEEEDEKQETQSLTDLLSGMNLRILFADDNPVNQKIFYLMLKKMNLSAKIVNDGEAVLENLRKKEYDLIFMDIQMPGLSGLETTRIIRDVNSDIGQKTIPIIALTAHAMQDNARMCLEAGMDQFLTKPVHPRKILESIAIAMNL